MPKGQQTQGVPRQRPVSCRFCRTRKLRCSRDAPCSNCVSRGLHCDLETSTAQRSSESNTLKSDTLQRIQRLERLIGTQRLEPEEDSEQTNSCKSSSIAPSEPHIQHRSAFSPQIQDLANDAARLERLYTGEGPSVSSYKFNNFECL